MPSAERAPFDELSPGTGKRTRSASAFFCGMSLHASKLHALKVNTAPDYNHLENKKLAMHPTMRKYRLVEIVGKFPIGWGFSRTAPRFIQGVALVLEFLLEESRTAPPGPAFFSVHMGA